MSEINVMVLSCRVANDPTICDFENGGRVFQCRVVGAGQPYKDTRNNKWRAHPIYIDLKAWNRGNGSLADLCEQKLGRGSRMLVRGILVMDEWISDGGAKNSRVVLEAKEIEFLDTRPRE